MNVLLLTFVTFAVAALGAMALVALAGRRFLRAGLTAATGAGIALCYGAAVLVTSLVSHERLLPTGETKRFCGFYLDCHLGVAVEGVAVRPAIGELRAAASFRVVTLRISSNARRATLRPHGLDVTLVDAGGNHYDRARDAEAALAAGRTERDVEAGGSYTVDVVFDVPESLMTRLDAREGLGVDRWIERALIGDEDALLHRRTLLALPRAD